MATNQSNIDILIKRRLKGGSSDAPGNNTLKNGELAMNEQSNTLYYGMSTAANEISAVPIAGNGFITDFLSKGGGATSLTIGTALTSDITVGSITEGDPIPENTTLFSFLTALLIEEKSPVIVEPTKSVTVSVPGGNVEIGDTVDVTVTYNYNRGAIYGKYVDGKWSTSTSNGFQGYRYGAADSYDFSKDGGSTYDSADSDKNNNVYTFENVKFDQAAISFSSRVSYASGDSPKTSKGSFWDPVAKAVSQNPTGLTAGTNANPQTASIAPKRKYFWQKGTGAAPAVTTSADVRALANNGFSFTSTQTFGGAGEDSYFILAIPSTKTLQSVVSNTAAGDITTSFTQTAVSVLGPDGANADTYKVYKFNPSKPYSSSVTLTFTIV